ncbi:MAG: dihydrolipoyl dehydrogenase, partial [Planctomycetota bacterium]
MSETFDAAVLGAGPGGYVCAIRLGQLGLRTALVERGELGGVCLNWGCIPSKAVIHAAELRHEVAAASSIGIGAGEVPLDLDKLRAWKNRVLKQLRGGIASLLKANGVELIKGSGTLTGPTGLEVSDAGGARRVDAKNIVLATGARPFELPFLPRSHPRVWTAEECLELDEIPRRFAIIGGGVIGLEIGSAYAKLGSEVTIIELLPRLMNGTDPDLVKPVLKRLKKAGVTVHLESKAAGIEDGP